MIMLAGTDNMLKKPPEDTAGVFLMLISYALTVWWYVLSLKLRKLNKKIQAAPLTEKTA
jgi:hypothetical protein